MPGPAGAPYVLPAQLPNYAPASLLSLATGAQLLQACNDATEEADSYMRGRFQMPLLSWGTDVTRFTGYIAVYLLAMGPIGMAPQAGSDSNITTNYSRAVGWPDRPGTGWFPGVQRQAIQPDVTPTIPVGQDSTHDAPQVISDPPRGWMQFRGGKPVVGGF